MAGLWLTLLVAAICVLDRAPLPCCRASDVAWLPAGGSQCGYITEGAAADCGARCPSESLLLQHDGCPRFNTKISVSEIIKGSGDAAATAIMAEDGGCGSNEALEIFILSGQSNMLGRGGVQTKIADDGSMYREWDGVVPAECAAVPGSILRLNKNLEWEEAHEPLHAGIDVGKTCGVGPGMVFAASLLRARQPEARIGLVPCAVGGTSITQWARGGALYTQMIDRTQAALKKGGKLRALLWYQGESDAVEQTLADQYEERLIAFFENVRTDLKQHSLPIIQVAIQWPAAPQPRSVERVRAAQKAALGRVKHLYLVDALGLPLQRDRVHLTTEGQIQVGLMLRDKYTAIEEPTVE